MSQSYPAVLPLSEVQFLISTLRERTVKENKKKFFKSWWMAEGFLLKTIVGEDEDQVDTVGIFGGVQPAAPADFQELAGEIKAILDEEQSREGEFGARPGKLGDGKILKLIIQYGPQLLQLIMLFLDKNEADDEDLMPAVG
jgi:hypothetical protein